MSITQSTGNCSYDLMVLIWLYKKHISANVKTFQGYSVTVDYTAAGVKKMKNSRAVGAWGPEVLG